MCLCWWWRRPRSTSARWARAPRQSLSGAVGVHHAIACARARRVPHMPACAFKILPEQILVPFPFESALSGVRKLPLHGYMWYRRQVAMPKAAAASVAARSTRVLLKFEAADWRVQCQAKMRGHALARPAHAHMLLHTEAKGKPAGGTVVRTPWLEPRRGGLARL